jgi:hypothetical protein
VTARRGGGHALLVGKQLDGRRATCVIDIHVHMLQLVCPAAGGLTPLIATVAGDGVPGVLDARELLHVDVHERKGGSRS